MSIFKNTHKFTDAELERIRMRSESGMTWKDIARGMNCSDEKIRKALARPKKKRKTERNK